MRHIVLFTVIISLVTAVGCSRNNGLIGGSGLIEATGSVISAEASGRVVRQLFTEGLAVNSGDTLVVIDPSRIELELNSADAGRGVLQAQLVSARTQLRQTETAERFAASEFVRIEKLLGSGTATQRQYDQAEFEKNRTTIARQTADAQIQTLAAQIEKTDADIARIERQLEDHYLQAPVSGVVTEKFIDLGELVTPGKPIARLASLDTVWVKVYLTADRFAGVKLGDAAVVSTESGGQEYSGAVVWTSDEAEFTPKNVQTEQARADLVYAVKVSIPNADHRLKTGMPVFVTLEQ
jgi:HlyD family secretion protein